MYYGCSMDWPMRLRKSKEEKPTFHSFRKLSKKCIETLCWTAEFTFLSLAIGETLPGTVFSNVILWCPLPSKCVPIFPPSQLHSIELARTAALSRCCMNLEEGFRNFSKKKWTRSGWKQSHLYLELDDQFLMLLYNPSLWCTGSKLKKTVVLHKYQQK